MTERTEQTSQLKDISCKTMFNDKQINKEYKDGIMARNLIAKILLIKNIFKKRFFLTKNSKQTKENNFNG